MPLLTPNVPKGLIDLMKTLTKEILRDKPENIYEYAAVHFEKQLNERDGSMDKDYELFTAYEASFQGQQCFIIPASLGFKCQRPHRGSGSRRSKPDVLLSFKAMESIHEEDDLYSEEKYQKAIYVIQRYYRRYVARKKTSVSTDKQRLTKATAAIIIQRTMRKLFGNKFPSRPVGETVRHSEVPQEDVDNVSEAASYTSSSTVQMLADSQEGRENQSTVEREEIADDSGVADRDGSTTVTQDEPPTSQDSIIADGKKKETTTTLALSADRKSMADENDEKGLPSQEDITTNHATTTVSDDTSTAPIGILSTKIGSNDQQNSLHINTVEVAKDSNSSEPTQAQTPQDVAPVGMYLLESPQLPESTPEIVSVTSLSRPSAEETFAMRLQKNEFVDNNAGYSVQSFAPNRRFVSDVGDSLKAYSVFYQDRDDPDFSDSLNESTMERDSLETEDLDVDSLESNETLTHASGVVKRETVQVSEGSRDGDAGEEDKYEEQQNAETSELDRVPSYLYGIHPERTPVNERRGIKSRKTLDGENTQVTLSVEFDDKCPDEKSEEESMESKESTSEESSATQIENILEASDELDQEEESEVRKTNENTGGDLVGAQMSIKDGSASTDFSKSFIKMNDASHTTEDAHSTDSQDALTKITQKINLSEDEAVKDEAVNAEAAKNETFSDKAAINGTVKDEAGNVKTVKDEIVEEKAVKVKASNNETSKDTAKKNESDMDEVVNDEAQNHETVEGKTVKNKVSKDESGKDKASMDVSDKEGEIMNEADKDEGVSEEAGKSEIVEKKAFKDKASKDEASKDKASKDEPHKAEAVNDEAGNDEKVDEEKVKDQASRDESGKDDASKDESDKNEAVSHETDKAEVSKDESGNEKIQLKSTDLIVEGKQIFQNNDVFKEEEHNSPSSSGASHRKTRSEVDHVELAKNAELGYFANLYNIHDTVQSPSGHQDSEVESQLKELRSLCNLYPGLEIKDVISEFHTKHIQPERRKDSVYDDNNNVEDFEEHSFDVVPENEDEDKEMVDRTGELKENKMIKDFSNSLELSESVKEISDKTEDSDIAQLSVNVPSTGHDATDEEAENHGEIGDECEKSNETDQKASLVFDSSKLRMDADLCNRMHDNEANLTGSLSEKPEPNSDTNNRSIDENQCQSAAINVLTEESDNQNLETKPLEVVIDNELFSSINKQPEKEVPEVVVDGTEVEDMKLDVKDEPTDSSGLVKKVSNLDANEISNFKVDALDIPIEEESEESEPSNGHGEINHNLDKIRNNSARRNADENIAEVKNGKNEEKTSKEGKDKIQDESKDNGQRLEEEEKAKEPELSLVGSVNDIQIKENIGEFKIDKIAEPEEKIDKNPKYAETKEGDSPGQAKSLHDKNDDKYKNVDGSDTSVDESDSLGESKEHNVHTNENQEGEKKEPNDKIDKLKEAENEKKSDDCTEICSFKIIKSYDIKSSEKANLEEAEEKEAHRNDSKESLVNTKLNLIHNTDNLTESNERHVFSNDNKGEVEKETKEETGSFSNGKENAETRGSERVEIQLCKSSEQANIVDEDKDKDGDTLKRVENEYLKQANKHPIADSKDSQDETISETRLHEVKTQNNEAKDSSGDQNITITEIIENLEEGAEKSLEEDFEKAEQTNSNDQETKINSIRIHSSDEHKESLDDKLSLETQFELSGDKIRNSEADPTENLSSSIVNSENFDNRDSNEVQLREIIRGFEQIPHEIGKFVESHEAVSPLVNADKIENVRVLTVDGDSKIDDLIISSDRPLDEANFQEMKDKEINDLVNLLQKTSTSGQQRDSEETADSGFKNTEEVKQIVELGSKNAEKDIVKQVVESGSKNIGDGGEFSVSDSKNPEDVKQCVESGSKKAEEDDFKQVFDSGFENIENFEQVADSESKNIEEETCNSSFTDSKNIDELSTEIFKQKTLDSTTNSLTGMDQKEAQKDIEHIQEMHEENGLINAIRVFKDKFQKEADLDGKENTSNNVKDQSDKSSAHLIENDTPKDFETEETSPVLERKDQSAEHAEILAQLMDNDTPKDFETEETSPVLERKDQSAEHAEILAQLMDNDTPKDFETEKTSPVLESKDQSAEHAEILAQLIGNDTPKDFETEKTSPVPESKDQSAEYVEIQISIDDPLNSKETDNSNEYGLKLIESTEALVNKGMGEGATENANKSLSAIENFKNEVGTLADKNDAVVTEKIRSKRSLSKESISEHSENKKSLDSQVESPAHQNDNLNEHSERSPGNDEDAGEYLVSPVFKILISPLEKSSSDPNNLEFNGEKDLKVSTDIPKDDSKQSENTELTAVQEDAVDVDFSKDTNEQKSLEDNDTNSKEDKVNKSLKQEENVVVNNADHTGAEYEEIIPTPLENKDIEYIEYIETDSAQDKIAKSESTDIKREAVEVSTLKDRNEIESMAEKDAGINVKSNSIEVKLPTGNNLKQGPPYDLIELEVNDTNLSTKQQEVLKLSDEVVEDIKLKSIGSKENASEYLHELDDKAEPEMTMIANVESSRVTVDPESESTVENGPESNGNKTNEKKSDNLTSDENDKLVKLVTAENQDEFKSIQEGTNINVGVKVTPVKTKVNETENVQVKSDKDLIMDDIVNEKFDSKSYPQDGMKTHANVENDVTMSESKKQSTEYTEDNADSKAFLSSNQELTAPGTKENACMRNQLQKDRDDAIKIENEKDTYLSEEINSDSKDSEEKKHSELAGNKSPNELTLSQETQKDIVEATSCEEMESKDNNVKEESDTQLFTTKSSLTNTQDDHLTILTTESVSDKVNQAETQMTSGQTLQSDTDAAELDRGKEMSQLQEDQDTKTLEKDTTASCSSQSTEVTGVDENTAETSADFSSIGKDLDFFEDTIHFLKNATAQLTSIGAIFEKKTSDEEIESGSGSKTEEMLSKAAVIIQSAVRGYRVRKAFKKKLSSRSAATKPVKNSTVTEGIVSIPVAIIHPTKQLTEDQKSVESNYGNVNEPTNETKPRDEEECKNDGSQHVLNSELNFKDTESTRSEIPRLKRERPLERKAKIDESTEKRAEAKVQPVKSISSEETQQTKPRLTREKPIERKPRSVKSDGTMNSNVDIKAKEKKSSNARESPPKQKQHSEQNGAVTKDDAQPKKSKPRIASSSDVPERHRLTSKSTRDQFAKKGKSLSINAKTQKPLVFDLEAIRKDLLSKKTVSQSGRKTKVVAKKDQVKKREDLLTACGSKREHGGNETPAEDQRNSSQSNRSDSKDKSDKAPRVQDSSVVCDLKESEREVSEKEGQKHVNLRTTDVLVQEISAEQAEDFIHLKKVESRQDTATIQGVKSTSEHQSELNCDEVSSMSEKAKLDSVNEPRGLGHSSNETLRTDSAQRFVDDHVKENSSNPLDSLEENKLKVEVLQMTKDPIQDLLTKIKDESFEESETVIHEIVINKAANFASNESPVVDKVDEEFPEMRSAIVEKSSKDSQASNESKILGKENSAIKKEILNSTDTIIQGTAMEENKDSEVKEISEKLGIETSDDGDKILKITHTSTEITAMAEQSPSETSETKTVSTDFENRVDQSKAVDSKPINEDIEVNDFKHETVNTVTKEMKDEIIGTSEKPIQTIDSDKTKVDLSETYTGDVINATLTKEIKHFPCKNFSNQTESEAEKIPEKSIQESPTEHSYDTPTEQLKDQDLNKPAIMIQKTFRGYKTRQALNNGKSTTLSRENEENYSKKRNEDQKSTETTESLNNPKMDFESFKNSVLDKSATVIQKNYRGYRTRADLKKMSNAEAADIGPHSPEKLQSESFEPQKLQDSAVMIQKSFRGYKTRKELDAENRRREEESRKTNDAAVIIQKSYKGYKTRKDLKTQDDLNYNSKAPPNSFNVLKSTSANALLESSAATIQKAYRNYHDRKNTDLPIKSYSHGAQREHASKEAVENSDESSTFIGPDTSFDLSDVESVETKSDQVSDTATFVITDDKPSDVINGDSTPTFALTRSPGKHELASEMQPLCSGINSLSVEQGIRRKRSIIDPTAPLLEDILMSDGTPSLDQKPQWYVGDDPIIPTDVKILSSEPSTSQQNPLDSSSFSRFENSSSLDAHLEISNKQPTPSIQSAVVSTSSLLFLNDTEMHDTDTFKQFTKPSRAVSAEQEESNSREHEEKEEEIEGNAEKQKLDEDTARDGSSDKGEKECTKVLIADPFSVMIKIEDLSGLPKDDVHEIEAEVCRSCADGIHEAGLAIASPRRKSIEEISREIDEQATNVGDTKDDTADDSEDKHLDKIESFVLMEEANKESITESAKDQCKNINDNKYNKTHNDHNLAALGETNNILTKDDTSNCQASRIQNEDDEQRELSEHEFDGNEHADEVNVEYPAISIIPPSSEDDVSNKEVLIDETTTESSHRTVRETGEFDTVDFQQDIDLASIGIDDSSSSKPEESEDSLADGQTRHVDDLKDKKNVNSEQSKAVQSDKQVSDEKIEADKTNTEAKPAITCEQGETIENTGTSAEKKSQKDVLPDVENKIKDVDLDPKKDIGEISLDLKVTDEFKGEESSQDDVFCANEKQTTALEPVDNDTLSNETSRDDVEKNANNENEDLIASQVSLTPNETTTESNVKEEDDPSKAKHSADLSLKDKDGNSPIHDCSDKDFKNEGESNPLEGSAETSLKREDNLHDSAELKKDEASLKKSTSLTLGEGVSDLKAHTEENEPQIVSQPECGENKESQETLVLESKDKLILESDSEHFNETQSKLKDSKMTENTPPGFKENKSSEEKEEHTVGLHTYNQVDESSEKNKELENVNLSNEAHIYSLEKEAVIEIAHKEDIISKSSEQAEDEPKLILDESEKPKSFEKDDSQHQNQEISPQEDDSTEPEQKSSSPQEEPSDSKNQDKVSEEKEDSPKNNLQLVSNETTDDQKYTDSTDIVAQLDKLIDDTASINEKHTNCVEPKDLFAKNSSQEVVEELCIKKVVPFSPLSNASEPDESEIESTTTKADSTTTSVAYDEASDIDTPDNPPSPYDPLEKATDALRESEAVVARMHSRRDSEQKASIEHVEQLPVFDDIICEPIKPMQELQKPSSPEADDDIILQNLQRGDTTRESSAQSESVVFGDSSTQFSESDHLFNDDFDLKTLHRMNTIAVDHDTYKAPNVLFKSVTIDDTVRYIDPEKSTEESGDSFCLDDALTADVRKKMMAYSISEADSDYYEPGERPNRQRDDFNISTALDKFASSDTDTTIISAATKIQAGARGFLTRRRLRRASMGTRASLTDGTKASFGNDAIGESLDRLVEEEVNKRLPKVHYQRQVGVNSLPSALGNSEEAEVVHSTPTRDELSPLTATAELLAPSLTKTYHGQATSVDDHGLSKSSDYDVNGRMGASIDDSLRALSSNLEATLAARRLTLQRGDAMRNDSTPDDDNGNGKQVDPAKITTANTGAILIHQSTFVESTTTITRGETTEKRTNSDAATVTKMEKIKWFAMRQNSMPVQIDSEVFRVLPKHMRKRIKSAEGQQKKRIRLPRD